MEYMEKSYVVLCEALLLLTNMAENQIFQTISGGRFPCWISRSSVGSTEHCIYGLFQTRLYFGPECVHVLRGASVAPTSVFLPAHWGCLMFLRHATHRRKCPLAFNIRYTFRTIPRPHQDVLQSVCRTWYRFEVCVPKRENNIQLGLLCLSQKNHTWKSAIRKFTLSYWIHSDFYPEDGGKKFLHNASVAVRL